MCETIRAHVLDIRTYDVEKTSQEFVSYSSLVLSLILVVGQPWVPIPIATNPPTLNLHQTSHHKRPPLLRKTFVPTLRPMDTLFGVSAVPCLHAPSPVCHPRHTPPTWPPGTPEWDKKPKHVNFWFPIFLALFFCMAPLDCLVLLFFTFSPFPNGFRYLFVPEFFLAIIFFYNGSLNTWKFKELATDVKFLGKITFWDQEKRKGKLPLYTSWSDFRQNKTKVQFQPFGEGLIPAKAKWRRVPFWRNFLYPMTGKEFHINLKTLTFCLLRPGIANHSVS